MGTRSSGSQSLSPINMLLLPTLAILLASSVTADIHDLSKEDLVNRINEIYENEHLREELELQRSLGDSAAVDRLLYCSAGQSRCINECQAKSCYATCTDQVRIAFGLVTITCYTATCATVTANCVTTKAP